MIQSEYPFKAPVYFAPKRKKDFVLDGQFHKDFWEDVPFTHDFVDIEGEENRPTPRFRTRAKMQWDEENLYVAALLEGSEIWGHIKDRDAVIFHDNDFEIFIDPSSSTQTYIEFEMNALNTVWDLLLTKSYKDNGKAINSFDIKGLQSAVHIEVEINKANADNQYWSVEVVIPFQSVEEVSGKKTEKADFWRVNFSRVQWTVDEVDGQFEKRTDENGKALPEDNWVWAPTGIIDIHHPQYWGFVFFTENGEEMEVPEVEKIRFDLYRVYYKLRQYKEDHGKFTEAIEDLALAKDVKHIPSIESTKHTFTLSYPISDTEELVLYQDGLSEIVER